MVYFTEYSAIELGKQRLHPVHSIGPARLAVLLVSSLFGPVSTLDYSTGPVVIRRIWNLAFVLISEFRYCQGQKTSLRAP